MRALSPTNFWQPHGDRAGAGRGRPLGFALVNRRYDITIKQARCGKNDLDVSNWRRFSQVRDVLSALMSGDIVKIESSSLLNSVALLTDLPERGLFRGQVGVIVESLDDATALVEFCDDQGRAYAMAPCSLEAMLVLRNMPRAT